MTIFKSKQCMELSDLGVQLTMLTDLISKLSAKYINPAVNNFYLNNKEHPD